MNSNDNIPAPQRYLQGPPPWTMIWMWMLILASMMLLPTGFAYAKDNRVLIVLSANADPYHQAEESLKKQLNATGYKCDSILLENLAKDFAGQSKNVNYFAAVGTKAALWLHQKSLQEFILVYCMVSDPDSMGLGGHNKICGVTTDVPLSDQFNLIQEALPSTTSIGILYQSHTDKGKRFYNTVQTALPKTWRIHAVAINEYDSVADAIEALLNKDIDIIWTIPDAAIYDVATTRTLLLSAVRNNTPVFGFSPAFVRAGALLGVGIDPTTQGYQAAELIIQLDHGTQPDKAVQPPEFKIAVNLIVAKKLSIVLPHSLIERSDYVFETKK